MRPYSEMTSRMKHVYLLGSWGCGASEIAEILDICTNRVGQIAKSADIVLPKKHGPKRSRLLEFGRKVDASRSWGRWSYAVKRNDYGGNMLYLRHVAPDGAETTCFAGHLYNESQRGKIAALWRLFRIATREGYHV